MNKIQTPGRHPLSIPVKGGQPIEGVRLVGNQPGKTLVVTAGVHGKERQGLHGLVNSAAVKVQQEVRLGIEGRFQGGSHVPGVGFPLGPREAAI